MTGVYRDVTSNGPKAGNDLADAISWHFQLTTEFGRTWVKRLQPLG